MNDLIQSSDSSNLAIASESSLPPIIDGHGTPALRKKTENFYLSIAEIFERWIARRDNVNTQRTYRRSVMNFIEFQNIPWPKPDETGQLVGKNESWKLLQVTVADVQAWRDYMEGELDQAPATLNARLASLSTFFKFLREVAAEMRLPILVPNPAHSQFIARPGTAPIDETMALSANRARQVMQMPQGETQVAYRDRALLKTMLYAGLRIGTVVRLSVSDFIDDVENPRLKIQEKGHGKSKRTTGINQTAADALREYINYAELTRGPLFRKRLGPKSQTLGKNGLAVNTAYTLVTRYLMQLPDALIEEEVDGVVIVRCRYCTHSLRATTATLLLSAGVDIRKVQELLGHADLSTTKIYDKRAFLAQDSASHDLVI